DPTTDKLTNIERVAKADHVTERAAFEYDDQGRIATARLVSAATRTFHFAHSATSMEIRLDGVGKVTVRYSADGALQNLSELRGSRVFTAYGDLVQMMGWADPQWNASEPTRATSFATLRER